MDAKKKKKNPVATVVLIILLALLLFLVIRTFYGFLTGEKNNDDGKRTEIQKLLDKNFDSSYPATEREVVKVYCRIMKQMYSGECSDDDVQGLFKQMRKLYDEELLEKNSYDKHFKKLQKELEEYKKDKKKVVNYVIEDADDIEKGQYEGHEQALVDVTLSVKENKKWLHVNQQFVVRKDEEGRWKILGWVQTDSEVADESD